MTASWCDKSRDSNHTVFCKMHPESIKICHSPIMCQYIQYILHGLIFCEGPKCYWKYSLYWTGFTGWLNVLATFSCRVFAQCLSDCFTFSSYSFHLLILISIASILTWLTVWNLHKKIWKSIIHLSICLSIANMKIHFNGKNKINKKNLPMKCIVMEVNHAKSV